MRHPKTRFRWTEAVEWAQEQDERRAAEQRRFAVGRTLLDLERLWALAAWTPLAAADDRAPETFEAEPFRRP